MSDSASVLLVVIAILVAHSIFAWFDCRNLLKQLKAEEESFSDYRKQTRAALIALVKIADEKLDCEKRTFDGIVNVLRVCLRFNNAVNEGAGKRREQREQEIADLKARLEQKDLDLGKLHGRIGLWAEKHFGLCNNYPTEATLELVARLYVMQRSVIEGMARQCGTAINLYSNASLTRTSIQNESFKSGPETGAGGQSTKH